MIVVCGATGQLGGRIARLLAGRGEQVRALVRPTTDPGPLASDGVEVVRADLREQSTLPQAVAGADTVVTTANAIGRLLAGPTDVTIQSVDDQGNLNLIRAADGAGVRRFVFVSVAGVEGMAQLAPFGAAKWAAEQALRATSMQVVVVRPDMFQEVWLAPPTGIDPAAGKALIYGRGELRHRYVAMDDVAALCAHVALADDPPAVVEFGGPEALSRTDVVAAFESATGRTLKVRHVPRVALQVGHRALARVKPEIASVMGMALYSDTHAATWDDKPLREAGIDPRPATAFIEQAAASLR